MSEETEWFSGRSADEPATPTWSRVVIEILCMACLGALIALALPANAAPLFSATSDGAIITLTDEPCVVKAIGNLPYRATWVEKDKTYEGCWAAHREIGMVLAYFDDLTIAVIPIQVFTKVVGA